MKKFFKSLATFYLMFIFAVLLTGTAFAYGWRVDQGGVKFERRDGTYPSEQWEWIDGDNSGKAYRYYFNALGYRLADTVTPDFEIVDDQGRWMVEGNLKFNEVTRLPDEEFAKLLMTSGNINAYEDYAAKTIVGNYTLLEQFRIEEEMERKRREDLARATRSNIIITPGLNINWEKDASGVTTISGNSHLVDNIIQGNKFTRNVKSIKIYSGSTWRNVMSLNGDGAYMDFENGRYNKVIGKIAHGYFSSVTDTECRVNAYVDGVLVATFEDFNYKTSPETIEFYFPTTTKKIRLEAEVTGSSSTRKIYLRDFRFKLDRTMDDEELMMELEGFELEMDDMENQKKEENDETDETDETEETEPEEETSETENSDGGNENSGDNGSGNENGNENTGDGGSQNGENGGDGATNETSETKKSNKNETTAEVGEEPDEPTTKSSKK